MTTFKETYRQTHTFKTAIKWSYRSTVPNVALFYF